VPQGLFNLRRCQQRLYVSGGGIERCTESDSLGPIIAPSNLVFDERGAGRTDERIAFVQRRCVSFIFSIACRFTIRE
jgi:hypothetical protein